MAKYKFVEHSKGEMEGNPYNNVALSNGLRTAVLKNDTGQDDILSKLAEGVDLECEFETKIVKGPNRTSVFSTVLKKVTVLTK